MASAVVVVVVMIGTLTMTAIGEVDNQITKERPDSKEYRASRFEDIGELTTIRGERIKKDRIYRGAFPPYRLPNRATMRRFKLFIDYRLDDESSLQRNVFRKSRGAKMIRLRFWAYPTRWEADAHWYTGRPEIFAQAIRKCPKEIRRTFAILADEKNYPVLYCCSYGHHRSVMIQAILYLALGVSEQAILDIIHEPFFVSHRDSLRTMLQTVFGEINRSGDIKKYLKKIGVPDEDLAKFRKIMLEG